MKRIILSPFPNFQSSLIWALPLSRPDYQLHAAATAIGLRASQIDAEGSQAATTKALVTQKRLMHQIDAAAYEIERFRGNVAAISPS
ncbi:hypothetical protein RJT34_24589 [Clitoria ternatea]|uniref:Uncharacterized protein n=1 Tax=Clitoria ternatea TaxID=43366 RepID=A0AAN9ILA0_CLITE